MNKTQIQTSFRGDGIPTNLLEEDEIKKLIEEGKRKLIEKETRKLNNKENDDDKWPCYIKVRLYKIRRGKFLC